MDFDSIESDVLLERRLASRLSREDSLSLAAHRPVFASAVRSSIGPNVSAACDQLLADTDARKPSAADSERVPFRCRRLTRPIQVEFERANAKDRVLLVLSHLWFILWKVLYCCLLIIKYYTFGRCVKYFMFFRTK